MDVAGLPMGEYRSSSAAIAPADRLGRPVASCVGATGARERRWLHPVL